MIQSHREKALELEKEARQTSRHANLPQFKNTVKSQKYLKQASNLYEKGGDIWIKQAGSEVNLRGTRTSLLYAANNYDLARKLAKTEDEKARIQKKKDSIEKKINSLKESRGGLEKYFVFAAFAIGSFVIALFFISSSLTGYAVGGLTQENSRWISLCLFVCGLIFAFFYFKNRK